jgi:dephospho-CoA kinase
MIVGLVGLSGSGIEEAVALLQSLGFHHMQLGQDELDVHKAMEEMTREWTKHFCITGFESPAQVNVLR